VRVIIHQTGAHGQREYEKQVADLSDRRIGDQKLEALLAQCQYAAKQNCSRTKRGEHLGRGEVHEAGHRVKPEPHN
jgi:hypothetical protein